MTDFPDSLLEGYRSFKDCRYGRERGCYRSLAEHGQTPEVMVIACCDSRSAPETIFNTAPGEIFVVRNVANLVPPYEPDSGYHGTSAALEFAVQSLKVRHIVVLGHGRCGGIPVALHPAAEALSPGDFIGKWMKLLGLAADTITAGGPLTDDERQTALERASIRNSIACQTLTRPMRCPVTGSIASNVSAGSTRAVKRTRVPFDVGASNATGL